MASSDLGTMSSRSPRDHLEIGFGARPRPERSNTAYKLWLYRLCRSRGSVRYSGQRGRLKERPEPRLSIEFATRSPRASTTDDRRADEKLYAQSRSPSLVVPYPYLQPLPRRRRITFSSRGPRSRSSPIHLPSRAKRFISLNRNVTRNEL